MRRHEREMAERINSLSIEQARIEIASGTFGDIGSQNHNFATSWLSAREKNLKDTKGKSVKSHRFDFSSVDIWHEIENDYGISKRSFGKKINFIKDQYKRKILFRDIEQAYMLSISGYTKPAVILAGGVIEELLRLFLEYKGVRPSSNKLNDYIKACENSRLIETAIHRLADSVRQFRNYVHLERENSTRQSISKPIAKGAVSSIFTIASDFT